MKRGLAIAVSATVAFTLFILLVIVPYLDALNEAAVLEATRHVECSIVPVGVSLRGVVFKPVCRPLPAAQVTASTPASPGATKEMRVCSWVWRGDPVLAPHLYIVDPVTGEVRSFELWEGMKVVTAREARPYILYLYRIVQYAEARKPPEGLGFDYAYAPEGSARMFERDLPPSNRVAVRLGVLQLYPGIYAVITFWGNGRGNLTAVVHTVVTNATPIAPLMYLGYPHGLGVLLTPFAAWHMEKPLIKPFNLSNVLVQVVEAPHGAFVAAGEPPSPEAVAECKPPRVERVYIIAEYVWKDDEYDDWFAGGYVEFAAMSPAYALAAWLAGLGYEDAARQLVRFPPDPPTVGSLSPHDPAGLAVEGGVCFEWAGVMSNYGASAWALFTLNVVQHGHYYSVVALPGKPLPPSHKPRWYKPKLETIKERRELVSRLYYDGIPFTRIWPELNISHETDFLIIVDTAADYDPYIRWEGYVPFVPYGAGETEAWGTPWPASMASSIEQGMLVATAAGVLPRVVNKTLPWWAIHPWMYHDTVYRRLLLKMWRVYVERIGPLLNEVASKNLHEAYCVAIDEHIEEVEKMLRKYMSVNATPGARMLEVLVERHGVPVLAKLITEARKPTDYMPFCNPIRFPEK